MRFRYASLTLAVAAVAAACDPKASNTTTADSSTTPPPDTSGGLMPPPPGSPPSITLVCAANTVRFSIDMWRYNVAEGADAMWQLPASAGNADSIMINPRASEAGKWPLEGPLPIVIKRGVPSGRKPKPSPGNTPTPFNYTITGVCSGNGTSAADTVVIDPIMILPR